MKLVDRNNNTIENLLIDDTKGPLDIGLMHVSHRVITNILSEIDIDIKVLYDTVYFDDSSTHDYSLLVDYPEEIKKLSVDLVVVSVSDHHYKYIDYSRDLYNEWWKKLKEIETPVIVLSTVNERNNEELYCPVYAMLYSNYYLDHFKNNIVSDEQAANSKRQYKFSCLNNKPKIERLLNIFEIIKRYSNQSLVTFSYFGQSEQNERYDRLNNIEQTYRIKDHLSHDDYTFIRENIIGKAPLTFSGHDYDESIISPYDNQNAAYTDAFLNIVTEATFFGQVPFLSEKSFKPLLSGQFFVVSGPSGSIKLLEKSGFDVYRDIIDHSKYEDLMATGNNDFDLCLAKVKAIHDYLETIIDYNWTQIYEETVERRLANRNLILNNTIRSNFKNQLENKIKSALNI
jgi:hypothetical protein